MTTGSRQRSREAAPGPARRCASAGLLAVFLAGLFVSASGLHGCPLHHHASPSPEAVASTDGVGASPGEASPGDRPDGGEESGSTCTCLADCQAGAQNAVPVGGMPVAADGHTVATLRPARDGGVRAVRHSEYFLPYPLGPPAA